VSHCPDPEIVTAGQILVAENVLDAFGHVSHRDPTTPYLFWMSCARPPSTASLQDFLTFDLDGEPERSTERKLFAEGVLHAAIYAARPDVNAICHHHAPALLPFCIGAGTLYPVTQTGGFLGGPVPLWDSAAAVGATNLLVTTMAQARSVAEGLGDRPLVLMRGHGATVVASSLRELVFMAVYSAREAEHFLRAAAFAPPVPLSQGELALTRKLSAAAIDRAWQHWSSVTGPTRKDARQ
jgi:ribulose-5-phosphate 4-epimerase/fuculose-1-phosphate aldolase